MQNRQDDCEQRQAGSGQRESDVRRLYDLLERLKERLGGFHTLQECNGKMKWPKRGVYFFFEPGEVCSDGTGRSRVVRVGTHGLKEGSKSTLWGRLSQHRGTNSGGGNHRSSIFRLLVGEALKQGSEFADIDSWGIGNDLTSAAKKLDRSRPELAAAELGLEEAVSRYIRAMPFLWLDIGDEPGPESERGMVERFCIALLSNHPLASTDETKVIVDRPTGSWLGLRSGRQRVRDSGLWNNRHVDELWEAGVFGLMERVVEG